MENTPAKKNDSSKITLIGIILVLLGVIAYLIFTNQEKTATISSQEQRIDADSLEKENVLREYGDLQLTYQKLKEEHLALGLETASLDSTIEALNNTISKVKKSGAAEIKKWKSQLAILQSDYDVLKEKLEATVAENDTLKVKLETMRSNDAKMADSLAELKAIKSELAEKVAIASILKAENIRVSIINAKGKESTDDVYKAKNIQKVKIAFNLAENNVSKKNNKEIYLRLIEPSGSTLFEGDKTFTLNGKEVFYTEKKSIDFTNTRQAVAYIHQKGSAYKPGKYLFELYADGSQIGQGSFMVK